MSDTKDCRNCQRTFFRPYGQSPSGWRRRRFCDRLCANAFMKQPIAFWCVSSTKSQEATNV